MSSARALHGPRLDAPRPRARDVGRWAQLVGGTVAMMAIASVPYSWPVVRSARGAELGRSLAAVENAFAAFILVETLFVPIEAWLGERKRPRLLLLLGVALVALGAVMGAHAERAGAKMAWYALGGAGAGIVYGGTIARALRRFTDRKAACVGVTAATSAAVLALALWAYVRAIAAPGAIEALAVLGAGQATIVIVATLMILKPPPTAPPETWF